MCGSVCRYVCVCWCQLRSEASDSLGVGVTGNYELPNVDAGGSSSGPLQEQCGLLTAEPSIWAQQ